MQADLTEKVKKSFFNFFSLKSTSISQKILAYIFVISSIFTLTITIVQLSFDYYQEVNALKKSLSLVEKSYAKSITSSLWELNEFQIQTQLDGITSLPGVEYVAITYRDRLISHSGKLSKNTIHRSVELFHYDKAGLATSLGTFVIYGSLDNVLGKIYSKIFILFISQFLKTTLVSFFIYICIQRVVTKHLIHISSFVKNMNLNQLDNRLSLSRKKNDGDELDVLVDSVNEMREKLSKSYSELNELNKELEGKVESKTLLVVQQNRRLEYSSRMSSLGEMAGGIAHEINNPIMIIKTASGLLRKMVESGEIEGKKLFPYFEKIDKTVDRISKIIHGLLALSRDTTNEGYSSFELGEVIADVLALCSERFKASDIEIRIDLNNEVFKTLIYGRRIQHSQVFLNLLHNAFDAVEHLSERWVSIRCEFTGFSLIIKFTDSGLGIAEDILDKVMQPFFTTKQIGKGTGLGLSLSMAIIKNHNGEFYIDSNSPNTCFVIVLPIDVRNTNV